MGDGEASALLLTAGAYYNKKNKEGLTAKDLVISVLFPRLTRQAQPGAQQIFNIWDANAPYLAIQDFRLMYPRLYAPCPGCILTFPEIFCIPVQKL